MIGLDPLLTALREAGLLVGVAEMARLQRVFALAPAPGGVRLESVLRALLVKSSEDRAVFDRVFEGWLRQADHEVRLREEEPQDRPEPVRASHPRRRRFRWSAPALAALAFLSLCLGGHGKVVPRKIAPVEPPKGVQKEQPVPPPAATQTTAPTPAAIRQQSFTTLVPVLTVTPGPWPGWLPLGLALAALAVAAGSWQVLRRRSWLPEPAPQPSRKGPPRVFLTPPKKAGHQLLLPREEETLVWGIGQYVAEEPTRRLDLSATVRATARAAGFPHLRFHQARHPREVWLWVDEAADDPAIPRLAEEIATALSAYGLPVERAFFRGIPDWLVGLDGQAFAPNEVDERRDTALVALLTDGRVLARHYAADDRRGSLDALLRSLSFWPRLAFVDFDFESSALSSILAPHFLDRIAPQDLATFLGAGETLRRRVLTEVDGGAIWAAACALAPSPVAEDQAFELRRRLGLAESPWSLRDLRAEAPGPGDRLQWPASVRARRINWLYGAEAQIADGLAPESYLGQALAFWEEIYERELKERTEGEAGKLWQDTPAHQHLRMERALLAIWNEGGVSEAIRELHSLHGGALRGIIEEHLSQLAPLDWGGPDLPHLPWRWVKRTGAEPALLQDMRLGGGMPPVTLRRPGRLWVGLAACLGLAAGALAGAFLRAPEGPPVFVHGKGKPADALEGARQLSSGAWEVAVATRKVYITREVLPTALVAIRWNCRNGEALTDKGMVFVRICPGTFMTDWPSAHEVTLAEYWIGQTEVTEEQYKGGASKLPITNVNWIDAREFCEQRGWRLPTEAEWEDAARAGTTTAWSFGNDEKDLGEFAWFEGNSGNRPHPVGTRKPNPWGLYDMHGNVWEWVADWYEPGPQRDQKVAETGQERVLRGGAFNFSPWGLRSRFRGLFQSESRNSFIGFRCARSPRRQP